MNFPNESSFLLESAHSIGVRLCRDANWHESQCNWLGDAMEFIDGSWSVVHKAGGPDLYSGTSGVGLFLVQLYRQTEERVFRRVALAALSHALGSEAGGSAAYGGFYSGQGGVGYAAILAGKIFGEEWLLLQGLQRVRAAASLDHDNDPLDVLAGSAGLIALLLDVHRSTGEADLLDRALLLGERLVASAVRTDQGWSWRTTTAVNPLLGLSHGAAGIGWSLAELHAATGVAVFKEAAEQAFAYERIWFSETAKNWPDLREVPASSSPMVDLPYPVGWCHGAPGIGLTRLRAHRLLNIQSILEDAMNAVDTTARSLAAVSPGLEGSFCLCHGHFGNAELLLKAADQLEQSHLRPLVEKFASNAASRFEAEGFGWPCGVPGGGETPGLMLGLAGIGYSLLRMHDARVPSVLLLGGDGEPRTASAAVLTG